MVLLCSEEKKKKKKPCIYFLSKVVFFANKNIMRVPSFKFYGCFSLSLRLSVLFLISL